MYLSYYNLVEKPFEINTDPKFLWLGEKHKEALATLKYGVLSRKGFLLLTGDVGTGKTTLINALLESLDDDAVVANVTDPKLDLIGFFNLISRLFNITRRFEYKENFVLHFSHFLRKAIANNKNYLLIIDEAHTLSKELLEQIRLLSNIELPEKKLINIFLVGQTELDRILMSRECRALRQRIALNYQIIPLSESETRQYIEYRLRVAGAQREFFNRKAIREIYRRTDGYPRLINLICDHALLTGYIRELRNITPAIIRECSQELRLPGETKQDAVSSIPEQPSGEESHTSDGKESAARLKRQRLLYGAIATSAVILAVVLTLLAQNDLFSKSVPQRLVPPALTSASSSLREADRLNNPLAYSKEAANVAAGHFSEVNLAENSKTRKPNTLELAQKALEEKDYSRAVELLEPAIAQKSADMPKVKALYAQALRGQADKLVGKEPQKAEILLHKAVKADPQNARAYFDLGKMYTKGKDYPKAIRAYQKAADLNPRSPNIFFNLGFAYATIKDYQGAEQAFLRVIELKPHYLDKALFNLAMVQRMQGEKQQCIENLEKALKVNPDNQKVRKHLTQIQDALGKSR
jgi:type II secretory pathway predicted ATPase ExeA/Tfp pilus assembly protein PilF